MSIYRQPYEKHDHRGGLDSGLVYYLLSKYSKEGYVTLLEQFPGGKIVIKVCEQLHINHTTINFEAGEDARSLPHKDSEADIVLSHPPYYTAIKYSEDPRDLSNCESYDKFIEEFGKTLDEAERVLKPSGHLIVIIGDVRKKRILYPAHSDVIQYMKIHSNLVYRDMVIWELTATGTPFLGTDWMLMGNYCLIWEKIGHDLRKVFA